MGISTKGLDTTSKVSLSKTGQAYKPSAKSAQANATTWATIQKALAKPQTVAQLTTLVKEKHNHAPFVGYAIRRGWLKVA